MTEQPQPPKEAAFFTTIRQWGLPRGDHGIVGGVVEGLGARVGLAAVPARLITVLAWFLLPGLVMLGYAAAWGLLPDRRGNIIVQNFGRGVTNVGALLGIAVLTLFGFGGLDDGPVFNAIGVGNGPWFWDNAIGDIGISGGGARGLLVLLFIVFLLLIVTAGIAGLIVLLVRRSNNASTPPPDGTWAKMPDAPAGNGGPGAFPPASGPAAAATASATAPTAVHRPHPWEPALAPGDPRLANVAGATPPQPAGPASGVPVAPGAPGSTGGAPGVPSPYGQYGPYASPRPHVPGPGKGGYLSFLAVLLIGAAVVIGIERMDRLAVHPVLAWGAIVTIGLGVVLTAVALTGRKLGFLGFLSVLAVLAGIPLAANADEIRIDYATSGGLWDTGISVDQPFVEESIAAPDEFDEMPDLTAAFRDDYSQVFVASQCWLLSDSDDADYATDPRSWSHAGQGSIRVDEVTEDTSVEIGEGATTITIPAGTSVKIASGENAHVVWEKRDLLCDFYADGTDSAGRWLAATNLGDPVLEIVPTGTEVAIFIKEDQS